MAVIWFFLFVILNLSFGWQFKKVYEVPDLSLWSARESTPGETYALIKKGDQVNIYKYDGVNWISEPLNHCEKALSGDLYIDSSGDIHIVCIISVSDQYEVVYITKNPSATTWNKESAGTLPANSSRLNPSIAVENGGNVHIIVDKTDNSMSHFLKSGGTWSETNIDLGTSRFIFSPKLSLKKSGTFETLYMAYSTTDPRQILVKYWNGSNWLDVATISDAFVFSIDSIGNNFVLAYEDPATAGRYNISIGSTRGVTTTESFDKLPTEEIYEFSVTWITDSIYRVYYYDSKSLSLLMRESGSLTAPVILKSPIRIPHYLYPAGSDKVIFQNEISDARIETIYTDSLITSMILNEPSPFVSLRILKTSSGIKAFLRLGNDIYFGSILANDPVLAKVDNLYWGERLLDTGTGCKGEPFALYFAGPLSTFGNKTPVLAILGQTWEFINVPGINPVDTISAKAFIDCSGTIHVFRINSISGGFSLEQLKWDRTTGSWAVEEIKRLTDTHQIIAIHINKNGEIGLILGEYSGRFTKFLFLKKSGGGWDEEIMISPIGSLAISGKIEENMLPHVVFIDPESSDPGAPQNIYYLKKTNSGWEKVKIWGPLESPYLFFSRNLLAMETDNTGSISAIINDPYKKTLFYSNGSTEEINSINLGLGGMSSLVYSSGVLHLLTTNEKDSSMEIYYGTRSMISPAGGGGGGGCGPGCSSSPASGINLTMLLLLFFIFRTAVKRFFWN